jgi:hypothetical protein
VGLAASRTYLETFWHNVYLRGQMLYDPSGFVSDTYSQPPAGIPPLPASRGFLIGPDQRIVLAHFGHDPDLFIETIHELLETVGDVNGDDVVDVQDLIAVIAAWGPCGEECPADLNGDGVVDVLDLLIVLVNWS